MSSLSSTGMSFSRVDEKEKQQALEEEQARLQSLKVDRSSRVFSILVNTLHKKYFFNTFLLNISQKKELV